MTRRRSLLLKLQSSLSWAQLVALGRSGNASNVLNVGDEIPGTYTLNGVDLDYPWIVMDFLTVELENGDTFNNVPIMQAKYLAHETVQFDPKEEFIATEETAQSGYYYIGNSGSSYTKLTLSTGNTIPYENYTNVYKTRWNSQYPAQYGEPCWARSNLRQYLNSSGTNYWVAQHDCDVAPTTIRTGFKSYMPAAMLAALHPIKIQTKRNSYMGGTTDTTYDLFWIAGRTQRNFQNSNNDGAAWQYYKDLLNSDTLVATGTYTIVTKKRVDDTSNGGTEWDRSYYSSNAMCMIGGGGAISYNYAYQWYRAAPCFALV